MMLQRLLTMLLPAFLALAACGDGGEATDRDGATLPAPTDLEAEAGDEQVRLEWSAAPGATGYRILRSTNSGGPYAQVAEAGATSYADTGLRNGTTYYYVVRAQNSRTISGPSSEVAATPRFEAVQRAPGPPSQLSAVSGDRQVSLSWSSIPNSDFYRVFVAQQTGGPYSEIAEVESTSYIHKGLENGQTFYYRITAINAAGSSGFSNEAAATPMAGMPVEPPPAPTGLTALAGNGRVTVSWDPAPGALTYEVRSSSSAGGPYTRIVTVEATNFTHDGLTNGVTYYYVVRAVNDAGAGAKSEEVSATPQASIDDGMNGEAPPPPENVTAVATSQGITVDWGVVTDAASYDVLRSVNCEGEYSLIDTVQALSYVDGDVDDGVTYCYVIRSANAFGTSADSSISEITYTRAHSPAVPPQNVTASFVDEGVRIDWDPVDDAIFYDVLRAEGCVQSNYTFVERVEGPPYIDDAALSSETNYCYVVRATNESGTSANSEPASPSGDTEPTG